MMRGEYSHLNSFSNGMAEHKSKTSFFKGDETKPYNAYVNLGKLG